MLQNQLINDREISKSLRKLKSISSDKKFRIKSLSTRIKTQQKQKQILTQQSPKLQKIKSQSTSTIQLKSKSNKLLNSAQLSLRTNNNTISKQLQNNILKKLNLQSQSSSSKLPIIKQLLSRQGQQSRESQFANSFTKSPTKRQRISSKLLQKDYQSLLCSQYHINPQFLHEISTRKCLQQSTLLTPQKHLQFMKNFYQLIHNKIQLCVEKFYFKQKSLERFLQWYNNQWDYIRKCNFICLDLSYCQGLSYYIKSTQEKQQEEINVQINAKHNNIPSNYIKNNISSNYIKNNISSNYINNNPIQQIWPRTRILRQTILSNKNIKKLTLCNLHLSPLQLIDLLSCILVNPIIYSLDISNSTSLSINRLGIQTTNNCEYLEYFLAQNNTLGVLKLQNLGINDDVLEKIANGVVKNKMATLRVLGLGKNNITEKSLYNMHTLMTKSMITHLDLSQNQLSAPFYLKLSNLRNTSLVYLNLTATLMFSQSLISFLYLLPQNKSLQQLILNENDFSHHWFSKIKEFLNFIAHGN